jgi:hypothetical protein
MRGSTAAVSYNLYLAACLISYPSNSEIKSLTLTWIITNIPAWVWPDDKVNKYENQPWSQFAGDDLKNFAKTGFDNCVTREPPRLNTGWLKATPL